MVTCYATTALLLCCAILAAESAKRSKRQFSWLPVPLPQLPSQPVLPIAPEFNPETSIIGVQNQQDYGNVQRILQGMNWGQPSLNDLHTIAKPFVKLPPLKLESLLSGVDEIFQAEVVTELSTGAKKLTKFVQTYDNLPIYNTGVVLEALATGGWERRNKGRKVASAAKKAIKSSRRRKRSITAASRRETCAKAASFELASLTESTEKEYWYELGTALVQMFRVQVTRGNPPGRWVCLLQSSDSYIIRSWNDLPNVNRGGNPKLGTFVYTEKFGADLPITQQGSNCVMRNPENTVYVYHLNSGEGTVANPYQYNCAIGPTDTVNGAPSPASDCFYYGEKSLKMFLDQTEFKTTAEIVPGGKLKIKAHFGNNMDNAFWDGQTLQMGDGQSVFYPLCGCADVVAHEMGHAVTQLHSNLEYSGESGCINEAYSDMSGETAEYSIFGRNDWMIAESCVKGAAGSALRYMENPERDGRSFSTYRAYRAGADPHYCSGIFNKAYTYATQSLGINKAFRVFSLANQLYWTTAGTMAESACGAVKAAADLGYDSTQVTAAFSRVDIDVSRCDAPVVSPDRYVELENCFPVSGLSASEGGMLNFTINVPSTSRVVYVWSVGDGDADMFIKVDGTVTRTDYDHRPMWTGSNEWVYLFPARPGHYNILIHARRAFRFLTLTACHFSF